MRYVAQRGADDCGVAVFAMLADVSYERAVEILGYEGDVPDHTLCVCLERMGRFIRRVWRAEDCAGMWPPPPFAEQHFAMVGQPSGNAHYVVMDRDGIVLDPLDPRPVRLKSWDVVNCVVGVRE